MTGCCKALSYKTLGSRISSLGCYQPYPKSSAGPQANVGFEKQMQISLLGNSQRNSPGVAVDRPPLLQWDTAVAGAWRGSAHGTGARTPLLKGGGEAGCKDHCSQHDASLEAKVLISTHGDSASAPWSRRCSSPHRALCIPAQLRDTAHSLGCRSNHRIAESTRFEKTFKITTSNCSPALPRSLHPTASQHLLTRFSMTELCR